MYFYKGHISTIKKNSISLHTLSRSVDGYRSLLGSKGDRLEFLRLTNSAKTVSLSDVIRTCPNLKELSVGYVSSTVKSATDADSEYQKEEQIERSVLPCLKKIDLSKVCNELCSSETLISLLLCPQLEDRGVPRIWEGGAKNFFFRFGNLHVAKLCALLGGFGGMLPRENFLNGAIWCVLGCILIRFCLYFYFKKCHLLYKK